MYKTKEPPLTDGIGCAPSLRAIRVFEESIRKRADMIGELLLIEVVRAGPDGMECVKFDLEDPLPFRTDPPDGASEGVSWHLTLSYGGPPAGDALGSRARWSDTGEAAAECVIDTRGLATEDRIKEGAGIARDLVRDLERLQDGESQQIDIGSGGDRDLRS